MIALFEKFSGTGEYSGGKIPSIVVRKNVNVVFDDIVKFVKDNNYEDIYFKKDVCDIYCTDMGYEISILLINDVDTTKINITVYGEHKRGRTRGYLKTFRALLFHYLKEIY